MKRIKYIMVVVLSLIMSVNIIACNEISNSISRSQRKYNYISFNEIDSTNVSERTIKICKAAWDELDKLIEMSKKNEIIEEQRRNVIWRMIAMYDTNIYFTSTTDTEYILKVGEHIKKRQQSMEYL